MATPLTSPQAALENKLPVGSGTGETPAASGPATIRSPFRRGPAP